MNTKTMEGLVGARVNMDLLNTPFRVYKEARREGDTATMERAMGYVDDFSDRADGYKAKADEGMKQDAEDAREKLRTDCEEAARERRKEREAFEQKIAEKREEETKTDTVEISEEGRSLEENGRVEADDAKGADTDDGAQSAEPAVKQPTIYTKTGAVSPPEQEAVLSVSV